MIYESEDEKAFLKRKEEIIDKIISLSADIINIQVDFFFHVSLLPIPLLHYLP